MNGRLLVVDPCPIVHLGLETVFRNSEFSILHSTEFVHDAIDWMTQQYAKSEPGSIETSPVKATGRETTWTEKPVDIILCDFEMEDGTSMDLLTFATRNNIPLVLFSAWNNPVHFGRMVDAGAKALVRKTANSTELLSCLRKVMAGKRALKRVDTRRVSGALSTPRLESHIDFPLTQREFDVLKELSAGQTNKMVAERLGVSYETVKEHVQHILAKLCVGDRTQAAILAVRRGLL